MRTLVTFRAGGSLYGVPVEATREVRRAGTLTSLPSPRHGVAGVMQRGDEMLPVVTPLGEGGSHVIVLDGGAADFGLLVDEVLRLEHVPEDSFGPTPLGQERSVVVGVAAPPGGEALLLIDPAAMARDLL